MFQVGLIQDQNLGSSSPVTPDLRRRDEESVNILSDKGKEDVWSFLETIRYLVQVEKRSDQFRKGTKGCELNW